MRPCQRRVLATALAAMLLGGCAATSGLIKSMGKPPGPNENERVVSVPQPGFGEHLTVVLHPAGIPVPRQYSKRSSTPPRAVPRQIKPPAMACTVNQTGRNIEYVAASRYGRTWKLVTAIAFIAEAAVAAIYLLSDAPNGSANTNRRIGGGLLGIDALITAGMFFIPRRDVLETRQRQVTTLVRKDCPAGVSLEFDGKRITVDHRGNLSVLGPELLDQAMASHSGQLTVRYGKYSAPIAISPRQRCVWLRARGKGQLATDVCMTSAHGGRHGPVTATLDVTPGTLSAQQTREMIRRQSARLRLR